MLYPCSWYKIVSEPREPAWMRRALCTTESNNNWQSRTVISMAAELINELRAKLVASPPECAEREPNLEACFDDLNSSLADVSLEELGNKKGTFSSLVEAVRKSKYATSRASEIVVKISEHRNLLRPTSHQIEHGSPTSAESIHEDLIARLEQECLDTQKLMEADVKMQRQNKLKIEEEFEKLAAELTAIHQRNLLSSQESFTATMRQIRETKDHSLCQLRLRALETKGSQTIQRLEAEIETIRDEIKDARKLATKRSREALLSSGRASTVGLRVRAKRFSKASPSTRTSAESVEGAKQEVVAKKQRRELFRDEAEEEPAAEEGMLVGTLEGEKLEEYIQSLKALVDQHRTRPPREDDPETPI